MRNFKTFLLIILPLSACLCLSSCQPADLESPVDTLTRTQWTVYDGFDKPQGTLQFSNNHLILDTTVSDQPFHFDEEYFADDGKITINSPSYGVFSMKYNLFGDRLTIEYYGKTLRLQKANNQKQQTSS